MDFEGEEDDDMDDYMLKFAIEESLKEHENRQKLPTTEDSAVAGPSGFKNPSNSESTPVEGFDNLAGSTWIYPTNYPERSYQLAMVKKCLFHNTLVCLPTGLGKTFIAAVVMYNFYRWYPQGKIVFMAPTKPLVTQQIQACFQVMSIPQSDMIEMTGSMNPNERKSAWEKHRVFFLTPQVLSNDLSRDICFAKQFRCLVVDEAHKALGNHAYVVVVRELLKHIKDFRVLALSATPGSDGKAVQQVITNLLISEVEIRTDESIDILPYVNKRSVEKVVVPLSDDVVAVRQAFMEVLAWNVKKLSERGVLWNKNPESLSQFSLLKERDRFRQNPPDRLPRSDYSFVEAQFALCTSFYHCLELLTMHGLRSFYNFIQGILDGQKSTSHARCELLKHTKFMTVVDDLRNKFDPILAQEHNAISHPKIQKLLEIVLEHFNRLKDTKPEAGEEVSTRVMIFAQYRDSVNEIAAVLNEHQPLVKAMSFVGRATTSGTNNKGLTHKLQQKIVSQFRNGHYNTLVSTCVGEEGLDIGEVDLIICFDAHKSPVRLVQRMGRTGRKRDGRIVMLVTKGKEEQIYNQGQFNKRNINRAVSNCSQTYEMYKFNPRMVPSNLTPVCDKMVVKVEEFQTKMAKKQKTILDKISKCWRKGDSGFLNEEELAEWNQKFKLNEHDINYKFKLNRRMLSLGSNYDNESSASSKDEMISLRNSLPWQTTLQPAFLVSHTSSTKILVRLMSNIATDCGTTSEPKNGTSAPRTEISELKNDNLVPENEVMIIELAKDYPSSDLESCNFVGNTKMCSSDSKNTNLEPELTSQQLKRVSTSVPSKSRSHKGKTEPAVPGNKLISDFFSRRTKPMPEESNDIELLCEFIRPKFHRSLTDFFRVPEPIPKSECILSAGEVSALKMWMNSLNLDPSANHEVSGEVFDFEDEDEELFFTNCDAKLLRTANESQAQAETMCGITQMLDLVALETPLPERTKSETTKAPESSRPNFDLFLEDSDTDCDVVEVSPVKKASFTLRNIEISPIFNSRKKEGFVPVISHSTPEVKKKLSSSVVAGSTTPETPLIRRKRKMGARRFLQTQAEDDDGDACDEDEDEGSNHYVNDSFIDDDSDFKISDTQLGIYMKSVKDVEKPQAKPGPSKVPENIYSQEPSTDDSSYEHDSFCVPSDFTEPKVSPNPPTKIYKRIKMDETVSADPEEPRSTSSEAPKVSVRIIVSSREVSGASVIISRLRMDHKALVHMRCVSSCDYILGNRVGVERKMVSEVANVGSHKKLLQSMKDLIAVYPKPYLLIEDDRVKANVTAKPMLHTVYFDSILVQITESPVKLLFSHSQNDSADILYSLGESEAKKGFGFESPFEPTESKLEMFKFYSTFPQLSVCAALNFCHRFHSLKQFINSSVEEKMKKGEICREKAEEIEKYLYYKFF